MSQNRSAYKMPIRNYNTQHQIALHNAQQLVLAVIQTLPDGCQGSTSAGQVAGTMIKLKQKNKIRDVKLKELAMVAAWCC